MTRRRVVITGIGAITPVGSGADGLWDGVIANRSAVRTIDRFDATPFPSRIAAQVDDFDPADHLDARRARRLDRFSAMSVAASRMAFEDAGLAGAADPARTGVWIGSALGGVAFGEEQHAGFVARGVRGVAPTLALAVFGGAGASNVALDLGLTGPSRRQRELVRLGRGGHRAGGERHPRRDRGRRAGRRCGGAAGATHLRRVRPDQGPVAAQRGPAERLAPVRSRPRRLRDGRGSRDPGARGTGRGAYAAAPGSSPRSSGSGQATTRTT